MRKLLLSLLVLFTSSILMAQSSYVPLNSLGMHMLDRMEIKQGRLATPQEFNTTAKAYKRISIARYIDSFDITTAKLSKVDYANLNYLQTDNFEYSNSENTKTKKSLWNTGIYKHKAALADYTEGDVAIIFNPVAYQKFEYDQNQGEVLWYNNRGIEMRGRIGNSFGFYTQVSDVIHNANTWDKAFYDKDSVIPGQAFLKTADKKTSIIYKPAGTLRFKLVNILIFNLDIAETFWAMDTAV